MVGSARGRPARAGGARGDGRRPNAGEGGASPRPRRPAALVDLFDAEAVRDAVVGSEVVCNLATHIPAATKAREDPRPGWRTTVSGATRHAISSSTTIAAGAARYVQESIAFLYAVAGDVWIDEDAPWRYPPTPARYSTPRPRPSASPSPAAPASSCASASSTDPTATTRSTPSGWPGGGWLPPSAGATPTCRRSTPTTPRLESWPRSTRPPASTTWWRTSR